MDQILSMWCLVWKKKSQWSGWFKRRWKDYVFGRITSVRAWNSSISHCLLVHSAPNRFLPIYCLSLLILHSQLQGLQVAAQTLTTAQLCQPQLKLEVVQKKQPICTINNSPISPRMPPHSGQTVGRALLQPLIATNMQCESDAVKSPHCKWLHICIFQVYFFISRSLTQMLKSTMQKQ